LAPDRAAFQGEALAGSGAARLRGLDLHADLDLCTQFDRTAVVPRRAAWMDGLGCFRAM
jgi:hypothetical protein